MTRPDTVTSSTVSAASVGPPTRSRTGTPTVRSPPRTTIAAGRSPGVAPAGTVTVNGTSARVRAGTVTSAATVRSQRPAPVAPLPPEPPLFAPYPSAPLSRTVTGDRPGLVTEIRSWRTVPGGPSR